MMNQSRDLSLRKDKPIRIRFALPPSVAFPFVPSNASMYPADRPSPRLQTKPLLALRDYLVALDGQKGGVFEPLSLMFVVILAMPGRKDSSRAAGHRRQEAYNERRTLFLKFVLRLLLAECTLRPSQSGLQEIFL